MRVRKRRNADSSETDAVPDAAKIVQWPEHGEPKPWAEPGQGSASDARCARRGPSGVSAAELISAAERVGRASTRHPRGAHRGQTWTWLVSAGDRTPTRSVIRRARRQIAS